MGARGASNGNPPGRGSNSIRGCFMRIELHQVAIVLASGALLVVTGCSRAESQKVMANDKPERPIARANISLASPGRIEGRTETIQVGASADGVVKQIFVKEGQRVMRGTRLAQIDCQDIE